MNEERHEQRRRRGQCATCSRKTHHVFLLGLIRIPVSTGRCLACHPLEDYVFQPLLVPPMEQQPLCNCCSRPIRPESFANKASTGNREKRRARRNCTEHCICLTEHNVMPSSCCICACSLIKPTCVARTDACLHVFCFSCISRWAAVENTCPLCKVRFRRIVNSSGNVKKVVHRNQRERSSERRNRASTTSRRSPALSTAESTTAADLLRHTETQRNFQDTDTASRAETAAADLQRHSPTQRLYGTFRDGSTPPRTNNDTDRGESGEVLSVSTRNMRRLTSLRRAHHGRFTLYELASYQHEVRSPATRERFQQMVEFSRSVSNASRSSRSLPYHDASRDSANRSITTGREQEVIQGAFRLPNEYTEGTVLNRAAIRSTSGTGFSHGHNNGVETGFSLSQPEVNRARVVRSNHNGPSSSSNLRTMTRPLSPRNCFRRGSFSFDLERQESVSSTSQAPRAGFSEASLASQNAFES